MSIINIYDRKLKEQLERKGFLYSGKIGEGIDKPVQFTLFGDTRRLSKREKPFCHVLGRLKQKKEHLYVPKQKGD